MKIESKIDIMAKKFFIQIMRSGDISLFHAVHVIVMVLIIFNEIKCM